MLMHVNAIDVKCNLQYLLQKPLLEVGDETTTEYRRIGQHDQRLLLVVFDSLFAEIQKQFKYRR